MTRVTHNALSLPQGREWLDSLPAAVATLVERWGLDLGEPFDGPEVSAAWVAPGLRDDQPVVLKIGLPHMEARDEIAGLRFWDGDPTVRLLEHDATLNAMLLERCLPGTTLREAAAETQDRVMSGLLRRLWRTPDAALGFRPLSEMTAAWAASSLEREQGESDRKGFTDKGIFEAGLALLRELPGSTGEAVLLATDLHAGNVLRATREPWLVIDPKPFVGDPAYDATQHLMNNLERLAGDPIGTISRFAGLLGVEPLRVRLWTFARLAAGPGEARPELARRLAP